MPESFTSYIPGYVPDMDRLNPGRKRTAPAPRIDDFEVARRSQTNPMFFTNEGDADSIFGSDEATIINAPDPIDQLAQTHSRPSRTNQSHNRYPSYRNLNTDGAGNVAVRVTGLAGDEARQPTSVMNAPPRPARSVPEAIEIKDEADAGNTVELDFLRSIPPTEKVKIFIGRRNRTVYVKRSDLAKSPMLQSYIIDDPIQGPFIMRPQLMTTHFDDFEAVSQYLRSGEYAPLLLENSRDPKGAKILDRMRSDEEYARELVRSGKLYGLAQHFGVAGMSDLVFRKVSEVDPGRFSVDSLVRFAEIIFNNDNAGAEAGTGTANDNETADAAGDGDRREKDPMEEWIIGKLAYNFREIMRIQQDRFWEVVKVTSRKMLYPRVLDEVANRYRATGGNLPEPVIELD